MSTQKLLEEKKKEFQKIYKKTHTEYGFPYAEVVKYEVVFAKNQKTLDIYRKKRMRERNKTIVAFITLGVLIPTVIFLSRSGFSDEIISYTSLAILVAGVLCCLKINYSANSSKLNQTDYAVLFSSKNYSELDFPFSTLF